MAGWQFLPVSDGEFARVHAGLPEVFIEVEVEMPVQLHRSDRRGSLKIIGGIAAAAHRESSFRGVHHP